MHKKNQIEEIQAGMRAYAEEEGIDFDKLCEDAGKEFERQREYNGNNIYSDGSDNVADCNNSTG